MKLGGPHQRRFADGRGILRLRPTACVYRRRDERYKTLKFKTPQTVVHAAARALEPARALFVYARATLDEIHEIC